MADQTIEISRQVYELPKISTVILWLLPEIIVKKPSVIYHTYSLVYTAIYPRSRCCSGEQPFESSFNVATFFIYQSAVGL